MTVQPELAFIFASPFLSLVTAKLDPRSHRFAPDLVHDGRALPVGRGREQVSVTRPLLRPKDDPFPDRSSQQAGSMAWLSRLWLSQQAGQAIPLIDNRITFSRVD